MIHLPSGQQIKVRDISTIKDTFKKQNSLTLVNGSEALVLSVMKQSDANTVAVSQEIKKICRCAKLSITGRRGN